MRSAIIIALIFGSAHTSFASTPDLGQRAAGTPYDPFMQPVKQVLNEINGDGADFEKVRKLLRQGRRFRYHYNEPYLAARPETTARLQAGDCKAKSLWLCSRLQDASARYVIGKAHRRSRISHAWVMWQDGSNWWILDPTNTSVPIRADRVSADQYIPFYSYAKNGAYRHRSSDMLLAEAVANSPVAAKARAKRAWRGALMQ
jgi:hypothetical protein